MVICHEFTMQLSTIYQKKANRSGHSVQNILKKREKITILRRSLILSCNFRRPWTAKQAVKCVIQQK